MYAGAAVFEQGFPTTLGAYDDIYNNNVITLARLKRLSDVVVTKYDSSGTNIIYATFLGGSFSESIHSLIVNSNNELYMYGTTGSTDFPSLANTYDDTFNGGSEVAFYRTSFQSDNGTDIFVARLNVDGTALLSSTLIGGSGNDGITYNRNYALFTNWPDPLTAPYDIRTSDLDSLMFNYGDQFRGEIMLDAQENVYVASVTRSRDFPTVSAFQPGYGGGDQDGVIFKFDPDLSNLIWSSYIGGSDKDGVYSIKIHQDGNAYVVGGTISRDFPITPNASMPNYQGGLADGFIAKVSSDGLTLLNSTYLGSTEYDQCYFVEIDRFGDVYVTGQTKGNFPITPGVFAVPGSHLFISKLNSAMSNLEYSTLIGNGGQTPSDILSPTAFLVDDCGNIYLSSWGSNLLQTLPLRGMPISSDAFLKEAQNDGHNFYLIVLAHDATQLLYGTYFGGNTSREHVDGGTSRFDKNGLIYQAVCANCGGNTDFPSSDPSFELNMSTNCNMGIFKYDFEIDPFPHTYYDTIVTCGKYDIDFVHPDQGNIDYIWNFGDGDTLSTEHNPTHVYDTSGHFEVNLLFKDTTCLFWDTLKVDVTINSGEPTTYYDTLETCADLDVSFTHPDQGSTAFLWGFHNGETTSTEINPIRQYDTPGMYQVTLRFKDTTCNFWDTLLVDLTVNNGFPFSIPGDTTICDTVPVDLVADGYGRIQMIMWSDNPNFTTMLNDDISDSVITVPSGEPRMYYVWSTDGLCNVRDSVEVSFSQYTFPDDVKVCLGDSVTLSVDEVMPNDTAILVRWTPTKLINLASENWKTYFDQDVTLDVTVITEAGCNFTDQVSVDVIPLELNLADQALQCDTLSHDVIGYTNASATTFLWSSSANFQDTLTNITDSILSVDPIDSAYYYLRVQNEMCVLEDSILVKHNFLIFPQDTIICSGDTTIIGFTNVFSNNQYNSIVWVPNSSVVNGQGTPSPEVLLDNVTQISVSASIDGCQFQSSFALDVSQYPEAIVAGTDPVIDEYVFDTEFIDYSTGGTTGMWSFGDGYTMSYIPGEGSVFHTYRNLDPKQDSVAVGLFIQNDYGCSDSIEIIIPLDLPWTFYIPNSFTPDGDKINDGFKGDGLGIEELEMWIFNRWGDMIFYTDVFGEEWDGKDHRYKSGTERTSKNIVKEDTYTYRIEILDIKGDTHIYIGPVHLIR